MNLVLIPWSEMTGLNPGLLFQTLRRSPPHLWSVYCFSSWYSNYNSFSSLPHPSSSWLSANLVWIIKEQFLAVNTNLSPKQGLTCCVYSRGRDDVTRVIISWAGWCHCGEGPVSISLWIIIPLPLLMWNARCWVLGQLLGLRMQLLIEDSATEGDTCCNPDIIMHKVFFFPPLVGISLELGATEG